MTPEETILFKEAVNTLISAEDIAEVLPLTQGEGSIYRKDDDGKVSHTKVVIGAEQAKENYKTSTPQLSSAEFKMFIEAALQMAENVPVNTVTYSKYDIESVKTAGLTGAIANQIIKKQHGEE